MRRNVKGRALLASLAVLALAAAGCGDDDDSSSSPPTDTTDAPTDETTATTEPKEEGFVSSLQIRGGDGADSEVIEREDPIDETDVEDVPEDVADDNFDAYTDYELVSDATGSLQMEVPVEWVAFDYDGGFLDDAGNTTGVGLGATPDQDGYFGTWNVPGASFYAQPYTDITYQEYLDLNGFPNECTDGGSESYDDGLYSGLVQVWEDCGGVGTTWVVISASDTESTVDVLVTMQLVTDADIEAAGHVVDSFQVVGPV